MTETNGQAGVPCPSASRSIDVGFVATRTYCGPDFAEIMSPAARALPFPPSLPTACASTPSRAKAETARDGDPGCGLEEYRPPQADFKLCRTRLVYVPLNFNFAIAKGPGFLFLHQFSLWENSDWLSFPACRTIVWLPRHVVEVSI